jgi:hypothetical protein
MKLKRLLSILGTLPIIYMVSAMAADPHLLPLGEAQDPDSDFLASAEEWNIGMSPLNSDQNTNQVLDGIELALNTVARIHALPRQQATNQVYAEDAVCLCGVERCAACRSNITVGSVLVCNPKAWLYAFIPNIWLHYLEHGSFSFGGSRMGEGRQGVEQLLDLLDSTSPSHQGAALNGDTDGDGLMDFEEWHFRSIPTSKYSSYHGMHWLPDGAAVACSLWQSICGQGDYPLQRTVATNSSYVVEHPTFLLASCAECGGVVDSGSLEIVNPREALTMSLSYLALHVLQHGGFTVSLTERVNPCLLDLAIQGDGTSHLKTVSYDSDKDGLLDSEEQYFGTRADRADTDGDHVLDGIAVARKLFQRVVATPVSTNAFTAYRLSHPAGSFVPCAVCAENVDRGSVTLTNSLAGLGMNISYTNLHYLEHGSFAVSSGQRINPLLLEAILRPGVRIAARGGQVTLRWFLNLGQTCQLYSAPALSGPWTAGPVFSGDGNEIVFSEPIPTGPAWRFYRITAQ